MALILANRVQETTTTTGTGTVTLAGAVAGYQSFSVIGNANTTYYTITSGNDWEVGIGTYTSSGTTLARTTVLSSSAAGAAITLVGTSNVFVTFPSEKAIADGYGLLPVANGGTGATTLTGYLKGSGTSALTALAAIPVADVTGAAPLASPTFTGTATTATLDALGSVRSNITTVAASAIDCSAGNFFTKTASGALTWTVTNIPASRAYSFLLELTNGGTGTQTWFSGIKWPSGTAPTLTVSGVDVLGFITDDGGTTWRGVQLMKDSR